MDAGVTPTVINPQDPFVGRTLASEFRLVRLLGRGGMGAVYLAEQISLQRNVAVKLLPPAATADPDTVERFRREAISAAKLQHPNIVQVYFFGQQDAQYFIAMEFVEGESLAAVFARKKRLAVGEALGVGREIARALAAAHEQGLVHRDVKPENVFIGKDGRVKLGDFGLARDTSKGGLSVTGQVMGTPYYMPPEQCRGATVDARADVYALGATLYHLMNGQPPYVGDSAIDIIHQQVASPVPPPESFGPGMPPGVVDLVRRMMAKDPAARPSGAKEVVAAIERLLASKPGAKAPGRPPSSPSIPTARPATKPPSRPALPAVPPAQQVPARGKALWIAVAGVGIALGIVGVVWKGRRHTPEQGAQQAASPTVVQPESPTQPTPPTVVSPSSEFAPSPDDPPLIRRVKEELARGRFGDAIHVLDQAPAITQRGPYASWMRKTREEAVKKLFESVQPGIDACERFIELGKFDEAERKLRQIEAIDVRELEDKAKELRRRLDKARGAGK